MILIGVLVVFFIAFIVIVNLLDNRSLNGIKAKNVGHGQYGTARWATKSEIRRTFSSLPFEPEKWRQGKDLPTVQGTIIGCRGGKNTIALVDTGDVHTLMVGAAGVGKTSFFLYPNLELACASGMSFLQTDTKGDVASAILSPHFSFCYKKEPSIIDSSIHYFSFISTVSHYFKNFCQVFRLLTVFIIHVNMIFSLIIN